MSSPHEHATADLRTSSDVGTDAPSARDETGALAELRSIRGTIDNIDAALVHLLAERFKATQRVGVLKAAHGLPAGDPDREEAQIGRLRALAASAQLDPEFAEKFLNFIISEVIRHHVAISEGRRSPGPDEP